MLELVTVLFILLYMNYLPIIFPTRRKKISRKKIATTRTKQTAQQIVTHLLKMSTILERNMSAKMQENKASLDYKHEKNSLQCTDSLIFLTKESTLPVAVADWPFNPPNHLQTYLSMAKANLNNSNTVKPNPPLSHCMGVCWGLHITGRH